jgi:hypothetical protein
MKLEGLFAIVDEIKGGRHWLSSQSTLPTDIVHGRTKLKEGALLEGVETLIHRELIETR